MKIVHLAELRFSDSDIEVIGEDTYAFIATFAYAIDEIAVFHKLLIQAMGPHPKDDTLLQLYAIQQNTITRVLSAKIIEVIKLFGEYKSYLKTENDERKLSALSPSIKKLHMITSSPSFKVSQRMRNKVTNHYVFEESKKNLQRGLSPNASRSLFLHEKQGNSFSPMGEEVVFLGRFWRYFDEETRLEGNLDRVHEWTAWNQDAAKWAIKTFNQFIIWIHANELPDKYLLPSHHYLEMSLHSEFDESPLPIIFGS